MDTPVPPNRRVSPGRSKEGNGRIELRDAGPAWGTAGAGEVSPCPSPLHKLGYLLHCSLFICRVCDRTLRPFPVGGPFPCQRRYSFNPARPSTARLAGKMPPLREGDRYFLGCAYWRSDCFPAVFPCSRIQFKNHEPGLRLFTWLALLMHLFGALTWLTQFG